jgi:hypothetical protein
MFNHLTDTHTQFSDNRMTNLCDKTPAHSEPSYELTNNLFADRRYAAFRCCLSVYRLVARNELGDELLRSVEHRPQLWP